VETAGERRALILAPQGRDARLAAGLLGEIGIPTEICPDLDTLCGSLDDEIALILVTEETLRSADLRRLSDWIGAQPSWSDLPFIVLTQRGGNLERTPFAVHLYQVLGNVSFLERPFHTVTLLSVARAALRSRSRQYEARDRLAIMRESDERLRQLNETLEQRVAARSAALERAHASVLEEIKQRQRAEEQLRQSQKMELVGQLTGGVAHDFNNLLMVVLVNLELLRKYVGGNANLEKLIDAAVRSARRGSLLTQRMLAFARRQELHIGGYDLVALLGGMGDLLERSLGSPIELRMDLPEGLPPALIDANQFELALLNLAVNARDAMPEGGELRIAVDCAHPGELPLKDDRYLRVSVVDTGTGMDAETLQRATEPFFSTKELGKGTGLGLSMIHGLANQLGGALHLESSPGAGTRAELWLPVARSVTQTAEETLPADTPDMPPLKVLLVDDDELVAASTRGMLETLGHQVVTASSGPDALQRLDSDEDIELLITDYLMPQMTGAQLAHAVRERRPSLPILLATGYADFADGAGIELPRLDKPYDQSQLSAGIRKVFDQTRH
jgi:signal transduction histidine kinase/CheY-like chemotaxis protein